MRRVINRERNNLVEKMINKIAFNQRKEDG